MGAKSYIFMSAIAVIGLLYFVSILGLSVYLSHWYSIVDVSFLEPIAPHWKHVGGAAAGLLTLSVIFAVLSFSIKHTQIVLIASAIMEIPLLILIPIIISYTKKGDYVFQEISNKFFDSPQLNVIANMYNCVGPKGNPKTPNCSIVYSQDQPYCCDSEIKYLVSSVTESCFGWMLGLFLSWIISMIFLFGIGYLYYYCSENIDTDANNSQKN